jgi:predicted RNase H-like nuclease (RuvC/YqgF family)
LKSIIVGFDAGLNSAIAVLSTEGEILFIETFRGYNKGEIIREILKRGRPILIATDKKETPKAVKDLARTFGCRVLRPKRDLNREEKEEIVREYKNKIEDTHQLDALASAFFAYRKIKKKIDLVERYLEERELKEYKDEVLFYLFRLRGINLEQIINKLLGKKEEEKEKLIVPKKKKEGEVLIELLKERIELEKQLKKLREEMISYKKLKLKFDELLEYRDKFERLKYYFDLLKDFEKARTMGLQPVLYLEKIENLEEIDSYIGLEGRIIFSNDVEGFNLLNKYGIKCLLTEVSFEKQTKYPILKIERNELKKVGNVYGIEEKKLDSKMKEVLKEELKKWIEEEKGKDLILTFLDFVLMLNLLSIPLYVFISFGIELKFLKNLEAFITSKLLNSLELNSKAEENFVVIDNKIYEISWDSTGWKSLYTLFALIISTPIYNRRKIKPLIIGLSLLFLFNVARITSNNISFLQANILL